ncbi:ComF family protein [Candidatus Synechococcus calcipolaris G9]|uniref:ComF family protein n=1 Tax=Candidatus Synechococcus calcipolaris G9 TaxID=1497997 RepID=A0ABT6EZ61_9SYNE|nr:ComF family protein [Candidatus Synechococcus calcipolaris]MDG2990755.1 ComF family protein [Candidatus Synechococcus calcipolaris G9]
MFWRSLRTLLFVNPCPCCGRRSPALICGHCQRQLQTCQLKSSLLNGRGLFPLFAWGSYGGPLKRAIAHLKYDQHPELGVLFGQWLAESWLANPTRPTGAITVVPIPLHPEKLKQRGFNQAELIARGFCRITGLPLAPQGLIRQKNTLAMFQLSLADRQRNAMNAFRLGSGLKRHHHVLLCDDIYTTGTTVQTAAQTLQSHNISVCGVIVVAATPQGTHHA